MRSGPVSRLPAGNERRRINCASFAPLGFDLMVSKPMRGDRRRDDDRYLFLEALISAQQTLYISWASVAPSADNSERFPSCTA